MRESTIKRPAVKKAVRKAVRRSAKKSALLAMAGILMILMFIAGCAGSPDHTVSPNAGDQVAADSGEESASEPEVTSEPGATSEPGESSNFNTEMMITVVSREEGSGTRGAFIELLGLERDGIDYTSPEAVIGNGTSAVLSSVASNTYAIGYVSLGSLNDTVRAVPVNGVLPSPATVQDGTYPVFRSFYLAVTNLSDAAQDFVDFILSAEGQEVVSGRGYITVDPNAQPFTGGNVSGDVVITGSTSVAPIMDHLREAYIALNPNVAVEVHSTGSGAGITAARDGSVDIGMSSRELRDSELAYVDAVAIAYDGIAIIVNNDNPLVDIVAEDVRLVFEGLLVSWRDFFD